MFNAYFCGRECTSTPLNDYFYSFIYAQKFPNDRWTYMARVINHLNISRFIFTGTCWNLNGLISYIYKFLNHCGFLYKQISREISVWVSNQIRSHSLDVIKHLYDNFHGGLLKPTLKLGYGWVITTRCFRVDVITYLWPERSVFQLSFVSKTHRCHST